MWKLAWGYKHFLPKKNLASDLFEIKEGEIVSLHTLNRLRSVLALGEVRPAGNKKISEKEKIDISAPHRTLGVRCANIFFFFFRFSLILFSSPHGLLRKPGGIARSPRGFFFRQPLFQQPLGLSFK